MRRRLFDPERGMFQYRRLPLFHATHVAPERTAIQASGEFLEQVQGADGVDFDATIVQIARVACEAEFGGGALGEVTITDALHASAHKPEARIAWSGA